MPHTYIPDVKAIIDALSTDVNLIPEEKLILLRLIAEYVNKITEQLELQIDATPGGEGS